MINSLIKILKTISRYLFYDRGLTLTIPFRGGNLRLLTMIYLISMTGITGAQELNSSEILGDKEKLGKSDLRNLELAHGPYLQHLDETSVTIVWTTNRKGISWIELAPDNENHFYATERQKYFGTSHGLKDVSKLHSVQINNLEPGTSYRYRVVTQEVLSHREKDLIYGDVISTNVYKQKPLKFTTNNTSKENVAFLMLNDIHGRSNIMRNLLSDNNWGNVDLVFFNGDMLSDLRSEEQIFEGFMDTAVEIFAKEVPMYYARGNHETRGDFADTFPNYFPSPTGRLYYSFQQGPVYFIVLDSGEDKPDSDIEYDGIAAFDNYRNEQVSWLKNVVRTEEFISAPYKVVIVHIPPIGDWHGPQEIARKFVPVLNDAGIDLMLSGHLHKNLQVDALIGTRNFPVIVNSNNTILKAKANDKELRVEIIDEEEGMVDSLVIKR